jgi:hypothetical protein
LINQLETRQTVSSDQTGSVNTSNDQKKTSPNKLQMFLSSVSGEKSQKQTTDRLMNNLSLKESKPAVIDSAMVTKR